MPAPEQEADRAQSNEQLRRELSELLTAARIEELSPADFLERLESIHMRYLGEDANSPQFVSSRSKALAAYDEVTMGVDRHHHLELLAEALGVEP